MHDDSGRQTSASRPYHSTSSSGHQSAALLLNEVREEAEEGSVVRERTEVESTEGVVEAEAASEADEAVERAALNEAATGAAIEVDSAVTGAAVTEEVRGADIEGAADTGEVQAGAVMVAVQEAAMSTCSTRVPSLLSVANKRAADVRPVSHVVLVVAVVVRVVVLVAVLEVAAVVVGC